MKIIKYKSTQKGKFNKQEVITLKKDNKNKKDIIREEFGQELSPDDLDFRKDNELTKEQEKNSRTENLKNKYNPKEGKQLKK